MYKIIFELSKPGKIGHKLPELDVDNVCIKELIPANLLNEGEIDLPEVSEPEVARHFQIKTLVLILDSIH